MGPGSESVLRKCCDVRLNAGDETDIPEWRGMQTQKHTYYVDPCVNLMYINMLSLKTSVYCLFVLHSLFLHHLSHT